MTEEGYGLEEEEEDREAENDEDTDIDEKQLTSKFNLKKVIKARNKLQHELKIRVPEMKERIGRLNLDLFGDPHNPDWESKLDILQEELDHPMTRTHPIAHKTNAVVREIKDLQIEYRGLNKLYNRYIQDMGNLIDEIILLFIDMEKSYKGQLVAIGVEETPDETVEEQQQPITVKLVEKMMNEKGGKKFIDNFEEGYKTGNYNLARSSKASFIVKARSFFRPYHPDPHFVARKIWAKYTGNKTIVKEEFFAIMAQQNIISVGETNKALSNDLTETPKNEDTDKQDGRLDGEL